MTPTRRQAYETFIAMIEKQRPEHDLSDLKEAGEMLAWMVEQDIETDPKVAVAAARGVLGVR